MSCSSPANPKKEELAQVSVQSQHQSTPKNILICDSLLSDYTKMFASWWHQATSNSRPLPGHSSPAHFTLPHADLDSLLKVRSLPDSIEAFFAFSSLADFHDNQITVVFKQIAGASFQTDTGRWNKWWIERKITGNMPVGFLIHSQDMKTMDSIMDISKDRVTNATGYFTLKSNDDKLHNQITVVFRPDFIGTPPMIPNDKTHCSNTKTNLNTSSGMSFYNLDYTSPCPPNCVP